VSRPLTTRGSAPARTCILAMLNQRQQIQTEMAMALGGAQTQRREAARGHTEDDGLMQWGGATSVAQLRGRGGSQLQQTCIIQARWQLPPSVRSWNGNSRVSLIQRGPPAPRRVRRIRGLHDRVDPPAADHERSRRRARERREV
jgi:hypothetical protein